VKVCPAKRTLGDYVTYVPAAASESGAKAGGDATAQKRDGDH
jgi:hypothetical protein